MKINIYAYINFHFDQMKLVTMFVSWEVTGRLGWERNLFLIIYPFVFLNCVP